jgi:hypothetical protein
MVFEVALKESYKNNQLFVSSSIPLRKSEVTLLQQDGVIVQFELRRVHFNLLKKLIKNCELQYAKSIQSSSIRQKMKISLIEVTKIFKANFGKWIKQCIYQYRLQIRDEIPETFTIRFDENAQSRKLVWVSRLSNLQGVTFHNNTALRELDLYRRTDRDIVCVWSKNSKQFNKTIMACGEPNGAYIGPYQIIEVKVREPLITVGNPGFKVIEAPDAIVSDAFLVLSKGEVIEFDPFHGMRSEGFPSSGYVSLNGKHFTFLNRNIYKTIERALFVGSSNNWCHFITQSAVRLAEDDNERFRNLPMILASTSPPQIIDMCTLITGIAPILCPPNSSIIVKKLCIVSEFGFPNPFSFEEKSLPLKRLRRNIVDEMLKRGDLSVSETTVRPDKIWLARKESQFRELSNRSDVDRFLKGKGFMSVYCDDLSLVEQIETFRSCDVIVAEIGSALTNLIFTENVPQLLLIGHLDEDLQFWLEYANSVGIQNAKTIKVLPKRKFIRDGNSISIMELQKKIEEILKGDSAH